MSFGRVLVANRGEIACRVIRTLRTLGISPVTVHSEADAEAQHVALSDASACIGPAAPVESYLDGAAVVRAALDLGAAAVHPGYGFLSENAAFARACGEAGLTFIGPSPEAMELMGDKARARQAAERAGVAPVPGWQGDDADGVLVREAGAIGFPLFVKAALGGGGHGMRRVGSAEDLPGAIISARREARAACGDGALILERLVRPARHVEVQLLGDGRGRAVALLERECSLQRRHQKVIEECPSAAVDAALRARLGEAACRLAGAVDYLGAGTVEFLLEPDGRFWFLEMNTRLQVEHGVTELVTGLDLVAWQIRLAAGGSLDLDQAQVVPRGHAIEARIYAEDPSCGFLPQSGLIERLDLPQGPGVRVDSGYREGDWVGPHYDPMLMKVLALGPDRETARDRLIEALRTTCILGPAVNTAYLIEILQDPAFEAGETYTHSLEERPPAAGGVPPPEVLWLAAAAVAGAAPGGARAADQAAHGAAPAWSPFDALEGFRIVPGRKES